jgi:anti-anti-sigma regulatory factor
MSCGPERVDGAVVVRVNASPTAREVADLRLAFLSGLERARELQVDLSLLHDPDSRVVQVVCAAAKAAERLGKGFSLAGSVSPEVLAAMGRLGLNPLRLVPPD